MLVVCKSHIKQGIEYLNTPHIAKIKEDNFKGSCVFCKNIADYKLFYSIPISKGHKLNIQNKLKQNLTTPT